MAELHRLRAEHAAAVLDFELTNREYFAASISDRGDAFFEHFAERFAGLLADQRAGEVVCHVLVDADGAVVGRVNLIVVADGVAELGYRVARHVAGQGLATAAVREVCRLAVDYHGLRVVRAAVALSNVASSRVLLNAGFSPTGPADPAHLGGKPGTWFERVLPGA